MVLNCEMGCVYLETGIRALPSTVQELQRDVILYGQTDKKKVVLQCLGWAENNDFCHLRTNLRKKKKKQCPSDYWKVWLSVVLDRTMLLYLCRALKVTRRSRWEWVWTSLFLTECNCRSDKGNTS